MDFAPALMLDKGLPSLCGSDSLQGFVKPE